MDRNPLLVGLTGGIGSGKSSVAKQLRGYGICVIDADQVARQVVAPGEPALIAIAEHFGNHLICADGSLDRAALREIVFRDNIAKVWLEQLTHPLISQELKRQLALASSDYAVLESPLLLESQQYKLCQLIVVVDLTEQQQLQRAAQRDNNSSEQIQRIIDAQLPRDKRLERADYVIDNSGSEAVRRTAVEELHRKLSAAASKKT
ncbi:MAG: dephospho-CoA kinase [Porticoccaceae bacterium]